MILMYIYVRALLESQVQEEREEHLAVQSVFIILSLNNMLCTYTQGDPGPYGETGAKGRDGTPVSYTNPSHANWSMYTMYACIG